MLEGDGLPWVLERSRLDAGLRTAVHEDARPLEAVVREVLRGQGVVL